MTVSRSLMIAAALSFGLFTAPAALADRDRSHDARYEHRQEHHPLRHHDRHDPRRHDDHHQARRDVHRHHHGQGPRYHVAHDPAPRGHVRHHWRAGHRLPDVYHHHRHVVHDYHHYRLYTPPHGHHWVRVDHDVVLTAVATGVVAAAVYGIFG